MPTPANLSAELERAIGAATTASERAALVVQLAAALARLGAGLTHEAEARPETPDCNLDVPEIARRMNVSKVWVYRHLKGLPFVVRVGRRLLGSERGLSRYLAQQTRRV